MPNEQTQSTDYALKIPAVLGLSATRSLDEEVPGLNELKAQHLERIIRGQEAYVLMTQLRLMALQATDLAKAKAVAVSEPVLAESCFLLARAGVPPHSVAVVVQAVSDAGESAQTIAKHRADSSFNPASVMKLVTTYAALDLLGPAWTWKTTAWTESVAVDGVLSGNLYLKGSGDPRFAIEHLSGLTAGRRSWLPPASAVAG